jgi:hypothetical protein
MMYFIKVCYPTHISRSPLNFRSEAEARDVARDTMRRGVGNPSYVEVNHRIPGNNTRWETIATYSWDGRIVIT